MDRLDPRLQRRCKKLVMAHSNVTTSLSAGTKALSDGTKAFSHTQALWRFLNNKSVTPTELSKPIVDACHAGVEQCEGDYVLSVHDWSRINYNNHSSKDDRLQMTHATDVGYELQSSLLVNAQTGLPLSVVAQNLVSSEGIWRSRNEKICANDQTHLDELSDRMDWIEAQDFSKRVVHIVDREADSVAHMRRWSQNGQYWLVRVKGGSTVRTLEGDCSIAKVAEQLGYQSTRQVTCKGQACTQWIGGTQVVLARAARSKRV